MDGPLVGLLLEDATSGGSVHGFRSAFRDWSKDQTTKFPHAAIGQSLAHAVASGTEKAYLRAELLKLRRQQMDVWADFIGGAITAQEKVTLLRRSK